MTAMVIFAAISTGAVVFLCYFFAALCKECETTRHFVLKFQNEGTEDKVSDSYSVIEGRSKRAMRGAA